ncbi:MAG TPA: 30S ribosomal protein S12 methylthiotransferase RimO, partial [Allosphingosinicella sp.]
SLPGAVPEEVKEERYARLMELTARISAAKLQSKIGREIDVLVDVADGEGGATGRSKSDAPEIDGEVHLRDAPRAKAGDLLRVLVEDADEHDLFGVPVAA